MVGVVAGFSKKAKCFYQKNDPATLPVKSYRVDITDHEKNYCKYTSRHKQTRVREGKQ